MAEIKDRTYYDEIGMEIGEGDLLQAFHFRHFRRRRKCYMYHIAILQESLDGLYWAGKDYLRTENKGHYWLKAIADKNGILKGYRIISKRDFENDLKYEREAGKRRKEFGLKL